MFKLFSNKRTPRTPYEKEKLKQHTARMSRTRLRIATIAGNFTSATDLANALELFDLLQFLEANTPPNDIKRGLILSDSYTLRTCEKLGQNKYIVTDEAQ